MSKTTIFLFLIVSNICFSQIEKPYSLGSERLFSQQLMTNKSNSISLKLSDTKSITGIVNVIKGDEKNYTVIGVIANNKSATFSINKNNGIIKGEIVFIDEKKAYSYYTDDSNQVFIKEVDINKILCVDLEASPDNIENRSIQIAGAQPILESLPGAVATVYLDFDGEVVRGTRWAGGNTINAAPTGYSNAKITAIWRIIAEDFKPFNINITTNRALFDAAPIRRRMMCIFTPTTTAAPGSGGVAYLYSFGDNSDDPCWAYNSGTRSAGETGSHEVGHTLGLRHDGAPGTAYYTGHGQWAPIMGFSGNRPIGHWSKGEYDNANQNEDDLAIITDSYNGFGYRTDDYGNTLAQASELVVDSNGVVNPDQNTGIISTRQDKDMFSFVTSGGDVNFNFEPDPNYPNLNIQARILNGSGDEVAISNPFRDLSASITTTLAGGTYFIEIDGVGEGNLSNGYSDYASLGFYSIAGSYSLGNNNQAPIANFEGTKDCASVAFESTSINNVDSYLWDFGDGNTSVEQNPSHVYSTSGIYTVSLEVTNANGADTITKDNFIEPIIPSAPNPENQNICNGAPATINLTGSNGYLWYETATSNSVIARGGTFETSPLTQSQTYYVSGTSKPIIDANVGITNIDINSGNIHQGGFYLIFDASEPILLKKAKVSAQGTANRTLELKNAAGEILISKVINIPDGESDIDIDITIPEGDDMQIGFATGADLFRNNQNVNYPYLISDLVSIKSSTATTTAKDYYYYLYDWEIITLGECETDSRTEVNVTVVSDPDMPVLILNPDTNEITTEQQYASYQWYLDDEVIVGATNQSITVLDNGAYSVEVFNETGCSVLSESINGSTLSVTDISLPLKNAISIYPNPTRGVLNIKVTNATEINSIKLVNTLGQTIYDYDNETRVINTSGFAEGLYFLIINNQISRKFIKI